MLVVGFEVATAWAAMLGIAYLARFRLRMRKVLSVAAVGTCYLMLVCATFALIGFDGRGALAAAGLTVPALVATMLVLL